MLTLGIKSSIVMVSLHIVLYSEFTNPEKEGPEVIPIKGTST